MGRTLFLSIEEVGRKTADGEKQKYFLATEAALGWTRRVVHNIAPVGRGRSVEDAVLHFLSTANRLQPWLRLQRHEVSIYDSKRAEEKAPGLGL